MKAIFLFLEEFLEMSLWENHDGCLVKFPMNLLIKDLERLMYVEACVSISVEFFGKIPVEILEGIFRASLEV